MVFDTLLVIVDSHYQPRGHLFSSFYYVSVRNKKNDQKTPVEEFLSWLSGERIRLGTMRLWDLSLASLSGLGIWRCRELWYRLQTPLGSGVAVAVVQAGGISSD